MSDTTKNLDAALVAAQREVVKGMPLDDAVEYETKGKKSVDFKFASAPGVADHVRTILNKHGLAASAGGEVAIRRAETAWIGRFGFVLAHESGERREYLRDFPIVASDKWPFGKATEIANTAAMKYWLMDLVCARGVEEDEIERARSERDDEARPTPSAATNTAGTSGSPASALVTTEQVDELRSYLTKIREREPDLDARGWICGMLRREASGFAEVRADEFARVQNEMRARLARLTAPEGDERRPAPPPASASGAAGGAPTAATTNRTEGGEALRLDPATCAHQPDSTGFCWRCGTTVPKSAPAPGAGGTPAATPAAASGSSATPTAAPVTSAAAPSERPTADNTSPVFTAANSDKLNQRFAQFVADSKAARKAAGIEDVAAWLTDKVNVWAGTPVAHPVAGIDKTKVTVDVLRAMCRGLDEFRKMTAGAAK